MDPIPPSPAQRLRRLLRLQAMYGLFATIHWSMAYLFLVDEKGLSLAQVLVVPATIYLTSAFFLLVLPTIEHRNALRLGFVFRILAILPFWLWPTMWGFFAAAVAFGLAIVLFWVPYNIMYFEHRERTNKAGISARYAAVGPFIEIVGTLVAGFVAARYGFQATFMVAVLLGVVPLAVTLRLTPRAPTRVRALSRLRGMARLRTLVVLDGVAQGVMWPAVPLVALLFLRGPLQYGAFFAALGVGSALAGIFLGSLSDRRGKRVMFLVPFAFIAALGHAASAFAGSVLAFGISRAVARTGMGMYEPFKQTVLLDVADDLTDLYIGRELLVNLGRGAGVGILAVFVHLDALQVALMVPALTTLVAPLVIEAKDLYPLERRLIVKPFRAMLRH